MNLSRLFKSVGTQLSIERCMRRDSDRERKLHALYDHIGKRIEKVMRAQNKALRRELNEKRHETTTTQPRG